MTKINKMLKLILFMVNFSLLIYLMQQSQTVQMTEFNMMQTCLDTAKIQNDINFLNRKLKDHLR